MDAAQEVQGLCSTRDKVDVVQGVKFECSTSLQGGCRVQGACSTRVQGRCRTRVQGRYRMQGGCSTRVKGRCRTRVQGGCRV